MVKIKGIREFFKLEAAAGVLLFAASILALFCQNSFLAGWYNHFLEIDIAISVGEYSISKHMLHWINDGLMAIFFLLVGLEIKREVKVGQLSKLSQIVLPGIAAIGGMVVPALFFYLPNAGDPEALRGWAIPTATDIAFALGVLSLLGRGVPIGLKIFLTALAIFDDLAAIIIIAIFYTSNLSLFSLGMAGIGLLVLYIMNKKGVASLIPYILVGIYLWVCVLKSGVHATLAGVALALAIPNGATDEHGKIYSPLKYLEHALHPWVAFFVIPLFGFANAGVPFDGLSLSSLTEPIALGTILGLFAGKQLGVFVFAWATIKLGFAKMPDRSNWLSLYGVSLLTGIGFTMSLFIGTLAYGSGQGLVLARLGILTGSFLAGFIGYLVLLKASKMDPHPDAA